MMRIAITKGLYATVDDEDFAELSKYKWKATGSKQRYYAGRNKWAEGKSTCILMHRLILGAAAGQQVDHINGDPLDNRRSNLRLCSNQQNNVNKLSRKDNTSGFQGVSFHKQTGKWRAQMNVLKKKISLGLYDSAEEASRAYKKARKHYFGDFAPTDISETSTSA